MRSFQKTFVEIISQKSDSQLDLIPAGHLSVEGALKVYSRAYAGRLTEALGEIFEACWWVLGDQDFFEVCRRYISQHPSQSYNLSDYGRAFSTFLKSAERDTHEVQFLADLANFEWLFHECFHAAPPVEFDHSQLHILQERTDVVLELQKNVRLFSSPHTVYPMWRHRGDPPESVGVLDWDKPEHLYIYKREQSLFIHVLEGSSFYVLELLAQGLTLEQAIGKAALLFGDLKEEQVSLLFEDLIKTGVIKAVHAK